MTEERKRKLAGDRAAKAWPHSNSVKALIRTAFDDPDPVTMFTTGQEPNEETMAVVVVKGKEAVRLLRDWAERTGAITQDLVEE